MPYLQHVSPVINSNYDVSLRRVKSSVSHYLRSKSLEILYQDQWMSQDLVLLPLLLLQSVHHLQDEEGKNFT